MTDLHELEDGQRFAKVIGARGNNVHEVQFEDGDQMLVNLPPKFRSLVWVKRGQSVSLQTTIAVMFLLSTQWAPSVLQ